MIERRLEETGEKTQIVRRKLSGKPEAVIEGSSKKMLGQNILLTVRENRHGGKNREEIPWENAEMDRAGVYRGLKSRYSIPVV